MGSLKEIKQSFNSDELKILDVAYASAWAKLSRRDPEGAEAVREFLRRKIVQIAKCGVSDPKTLSGLALEMMPPAPGRSGKRGRVLSKRPHRS